MEEAVCHGLGSRSIALQKRMLREYARGLRTFGEINDEDVEAFIERLDGWTGTKVRSVLSSLGSPDRRRSEYALQRAEKANGMLLECLADMRETLLPLPGSARGLGSEPRAEPSRTHMHGEIVRRWPFDLS